MRKQYIAGNWKMNTTSAEAVSLAKALISGLGDKTSKVMIAPPFTVLSKMAEVLRGSNILLGAQNCSNELKGAFTGEISVEMLKDAGVQVVILGHSERRIIYKENNVFINEKIKQALGIGLEVILCVGETLEERESGNVAEVVDKQLVGGLDGISTQDFEQKITIAYEPVWAIGTGKTSTPSDANEVHMMIRNRIKELYGENSANNIVIQYGGSVKPSNAKELLSQEHVDGALVGGAALEAESFIGIVQY